MTKKDYELIADSLKNSWLSSVKFPTEDNQEFYQRVVIRLGHNLEAENPRFNEKKFFKACGFKEFEE